jgi:hypothetical protein
VLTPSGKRLLRNFLDIVAAVSGKRDGEKL